MDSIGANSLNKVSVITKGGSIEKKLDTYLQNWRYAESQVKKSYTSFSGEAKQLLNLQMLMNSLEFKAQLAAKTGEAVSSTIRRAQQMGSS